MGRFTKDDAAITANDPSSLRSCEGQLAVFTGGKLGFVVLLMAVAPAQSLNNTFIQAIIREDHALTMAGTPTPRSSATSVT